MFKLPITTASALSLTVSTSLIKVTISANESLSASDANKIASIRPSSNSTFASAVAFADTNKASAADLAATIAAVRANSSAACFET